VTLDVESSPSSHREQFSILLENCFRRKFHHVLNTSDALISTLRSGVSLMIERGREYNPSTLVLLATLNESEGIVPTLSELRYHLNKAFYLVVDGRSIDDTVDLAQKMGATVITQEGIGKGDAINSGLRYARNRAFDFVVLIDADYTYPAEHIEEMFDILKKKPDVGMVCGCRFNHRYNLNSMRNMFFLGNRLLAFSHNLFNGVDLDDPLTGLRVVRWEILRNWRPKSQGFDVEVELNYFVEKNGYSIVEIPINYRPRLGEKKLKMRHGLTILSRIIRETRGMS
jgi:glycosyltransferase involved in cell wall biosynthesis